MGLTKQQIFNPHNKGINKTVLREFIHFSGNLINNLLPVSVGLVKNSALASQV